LYRPFPYKEIAEALKGKKAVCVLDRADSMSGFGGPLFTDIRSALYGTTQAPVINRIFGLGGRDYKIEDAIAVFDELMALKDGSSVELIRYITI
ncbi:MAG: pyruvate ferredoxin oxidoreductase, partial [Deltaproteobacteria bacterium]|nr:pyruvate ferredoxin oxidoreductase [Deltaproteobacteria bacterium]